MEELLVERDGRGFDSAEQARRLIDQTLAAVEADPEAGPLLRAADLRARYCLTDVGLTVGVAPGEEGACLRWSFAAEQPFEARLRLQMDSAVANRLLQGLESVPVAVARGRIVAEGDSDAVLRYLPVMPLIARHYRAVLERECPELLLER
jgi:hypothetical protein